MVEILRLKATCKVTAVVKSILRIMATHPKTKQKSYYEKEKQIIKEEKQKEL